MREGEKEARGREKGVRERKKGSELRQGSEGGDKINAGG